jgi:uncharacterized protein YndB with AHSA1/START domain
MLLHCNWLQNASIDYGCEMTDQTVKHATFAFERRCAAPVERVFAAFASPEARAAWGAPSDTAAFFYEQADFREGGIDVFRCGDKANPQYSGVSTYLDIVPNARIVSSEVVETQGRKLMISLSTTAFEPDGDATTVKVTVQVASLAGDDMLKGAEFGHNASLDNLAKFFALPASAARGSAEAQASRDAHPLTPAD